MNFNPPAPFKNFGVLYLGILHKVHSLKMAKKFGEYDPEEVVLFLKAQVSTLSEEVLKVIIDHKIDGEVFLEMNDEHLREVVPLLGDRLKIKRVIETAKSSTKSSVSCVAISMYQHARA
jgi:Mg/Co/Ni transporter MgtE